MTIYKMPKSMPDEMTNRAKVLADRAVSRAARGFPLSAEAVQAALMPPEMLAHVRALAKEIQGIPEHHNVTSVLRREGRPDGLAGLTRGVILQIGARGHSAIFYTPKNTPYRSVYGYTEDANFGARLDLSMLSEPDRDALAQWCNAVVRARRMSVLCATTVRAVAGKCENMSMMMAWWPFLKTLISPRDNKIWRDKLDRTPKRGLVSHMPHPDTVNLFADRIRAAELVLLGCEMLPEDVPTDTAPLTVHVAAIEALTTDPKFTVEGTV